ncbi:SAM-dependent methyltransferase [Rhizorhabdus argentea]|uniref:SAM-dependent methyltransferase n=1 Tax=Rhizorhabdus argentea TaxID=1387174 RepID=UPI0030ED7E09
MPEGGFGRGLSVGCGSGGKEMKLIVQGIVETFDLFEIGEGRRAQIEAKAEEFGVGDRVTIHIGNAFEADPTGAVDLVYWNNALHHMFDARQAVAWSHKALRTGGLFAMDDFVGPTRFQWPAADLETAFRVRAILPEHYLRHPKSPSVSLSRTVDRPSIDHMMQADPTEAADSDSILTAVERIFPNAEIIPTGGVIYHLALSDVLANFDDEADATLLQSLLLLDESLAQSGRTQYAVALATK